MSVHLKGIFKYEMQFVDKFEIYTYNLMEIFHPRF